ncbi:unnamed protein product [Phytophthora fragariaefolia]|uniref:Unnamed protein product n=1 Tax=Phytophthora fragariaefolia TaxID=1490495 RepID=A0A9W6U4I9_9STRA|nr:unnamed protein product [Phytophthora fragariaefolia]
MLDDEIFTVNVFNNKHALKHTIGKIEEKMKLGGNPQFEQLKRSSLDGNRVGFDDIPTHYDIVVTSTVGTNGLGSYLELGLVANNSKYRFQKCNTCLDTISTSLKFDDNSLGQPYPWVVPPAAPATFRRVQPVEQALGAH